MRRSRFLGAATAAVSTALVVAAPSPGEHRLPASAKPSMGAFVCEENRDVEIRDRSIRSTGDGVVASGNCSLRIVDSHVMAAGVGIRADGNADVEIVGSFVQGRGAAVYADGNADLRYRDSTLRGGVGAEGNAELTDGGGNLFERIPGAPDSLLTPGQPLSCGDRDRLTVVHRYVESVGDGVVLEGDCELLLSDSHVRAGAAAVRVLGGGSIRIRNSTLEGDGHAVAIGAGGTVTVAGSNLAGAVDAGAGLYLDRGGNSRGVGAPSADVGTVTGTSRTRSGGGIRVGPGGIEIDGRGEDAGRIRVGPGGVVIEGRGDGARRRPIERCEELCELWPALTSSRQECIGVVVDALGYPIDETPACVAVETEAQCRACWRSVRASDRACRTAYDRCLAR